MTINPPRGAEPTFAVPSPKGQFPVRGPRGMEKVEEPEKKGK